MPDFIPRRDADLVTWGDNFTAKIQTLGPALSIDPAMIADVVGRFWGYVDAYTRANDPLTRSPVNVLSKLGARSAYVAAVRTASGIVRTHPDVTETALSTLGLKVPRRHKPKVPAPMQAPRINILSVVGMTIEGVLRSVDKVTGSGRPAGVSSALLFYALGESAPNDERAWTYLQMTSRARVRLNVPGTHAPGTKIWLTACWCSPTSQRGPMGPNVSTHIGSEAPRLVA